MEFSDLTVDILSLIRSNSSGSRHILEVSYENIGSIASRGTGGRLYWSENNVLDSSDKLFRTEYIPPINSNSVFRKTILLSESPKPTDKFLIIEADGGNRIRELSELNNVDMVGIPGRVTDPLTNPDVTISDLSLNTNTITQGYGFVPRYRLNNIGNSPAGTSTTRYVMSKDAILGNSDDITPTFLANGGQDSSLAVGESRLETNDYLAVYANVESGSYNFFAIADSSNNIIESNEANNVSRITINYVLPPKPDLVIEEINIPTISNVGSYLNLSYTIKNIDIGYVGYSQIGFYLSQDTILDSSDLALNSYLATSSTPNGVPISRNYSIYLDPSRVSAGNYNLIAKVDPNSTVVESNETNNILSSPLSLNSLQRPDLELIDVSTTILRTGQLEPIRYKIKSNGSSSRNSITTFYLSSDSTINTSQDTNIGTDSVRELNTNEQREENLTVYINPSLVLNGSNTYYLIAVTDFLNGVIESNENNNVLVTQVTTIDSGATQYSNTVGYGLVDASKALSKILGNTVSEVSNVGVWNLDMIKAPEVWNAGYTGSGITVAVIDTGVDYNHPDLINNIWTNPNEIPNNGIDDDGNGFIDDVRGWDFVSNDNAPLDSNGHGTHVSGIIAASRNSFGVTGVAPDARIMPLRALGGGDEWGNVNNAIRYAVDNGARVINMSLGGNTMDQDGRLRESIQYASDRGVIVVMAAGNNALSSPLLPGIHANQWGIVVGAVSSNESLAGYSNRAGSNPIIGYVTAPGSANSTLPNRGYGSRQGTSMASPHVAGVVALLLSANPNLTDADIRSLLTI